MRVKSSYLIAAGLALALAGWLLSGQLQSAAQPDHAAEQAAAADGERRIATVRVREMAAEPVEREVVLNGRTEAARWVELRAETNGRIVAIGAERGRLIAAGAEVVSLDPRERRSMVAQAEAALAMREMEHEAAERLGEQGFQAETRVAEAKANLEAARAALDHARLNLAHTRITAPFAGVLDKRPVEMGDFVDIGDPVARVIELDPLVVSADVAERDIARITVGMEGRARLVGGAELEGRVRYVGREADPATRTFRVELEVPNAELRHPAGVSAELRLVDERLLAHRVPAALLALDDLGRVGIKSVNGEDEVVFHRVDIVRADADAVWLAGLPEIVRLITVGQGFVRPGDIVRPVPEGAAVESGPLVAEQGR
jgi:membrane fusion protein, multidrug efflux system